MARIAFIGAGSMKFVRATIVDLLSYPDLPELEIVLMDIDAARLERARKLAERIALQAGRPLKVRTAPTQREAVEGADFVMITVMVGGMKHYETDYTIPQRFGVEQAVGDTIGPGAVFRVVRTWGVLTELAANCRDIAPGAWVLNYANPMAMLTRVLIEAGHARSVGLCHSIPTAIPILAEWLGIPAGEIVYLAAGLNHLAYYLKLEHRGEDLYPRLLAEADRIIAEAETWEASTWRRERYGYEWVRMELLRALGYFPAEGPWHQGDYYPWFRKSPQHLSTYGPLSGWSFDFDSRLAKGGAEEMEQQIAGALPVELSRSIQPGAPVIHAILTDRPERVYANVRNDGVIDNLPASCVVEVPCLVDGAGVHPCHVGPLPPQLAAVSLPHTSVHELTMLACKRRSRDLLRQALQADPLTGAVCTLPRIAALTDALMAENAAYMDGWA